MLNVFMLDDRNGYSKHIQDALEDIGEYKLLKFNRIKGLYNNIVTSRPQVIFMPSGKAVSPSARRILSDFPFIPVIAYGEFARNVKKSNSKIHKLLTAGYAGCIAVETLLNKESLVFGVKNIIWRGLAKPELWEKEYSIARAETRNKVYRGVLAASLTFLILVITGFIAKDKVSITENLSPVIYSVPYLNLSSLALSRNSLWTSDWQTQNIYKHSLGRNLEIERVYPFPDMRFSALVLADGYIWTLDPWQKKIRKHNLDKKLSIVKEFQTPGTNPTGLAYDGKYLISSDNAQGKLYIHKLDDKLTVLKEYSLPADNPIGIYADGKYTWIADAMTNKIYCCYIDDFDLAVKNIFIPPDYEGMKFSSISGDSEYLWLASEKDSKIYKYPKKLLESVE